MLTIILTSLISTMLFVLILPILIYFKYHKRLDWKQIKIFYKSWMEEIL